MTKSELKQLIAEDQIKKVIQWLLEATERMRDSDLHNEVVQQSSKYNDYLKSKMAGTKSQDNLDVQIAKINEALTYIIDKLPDTPTTQQPNHLTTQPTSRKPLYILGAILLIAVLAFLLRPLLVGSGKPFEITISLQGPELPDYPPLKDVKLGIRLDNKWEEAAVDEHGDADFKGIPGNFEGKMVPVRLLDSKYWQTQQDSVALEGKSASIQVAPNGVLGQIHGNVRSVSGNEYIEGVEIRLDNGQLSAVTDATGYFEFNIPANLQKESYNLTATKSGYEADSRFAYPETGAIEIRLAPKK